MTQPTRVQRPQAAPNRDDDTPALHATVAALAAFFWLIAVAAIMRITHVPGWVALVVHVVIGGALAVAGMNRAPRALSLRSIAYRFLAMFAAGQWLFWNVADTGRGGQELLAMVCQLALLGAVAATVYCGVRGGWWKWALGLGGLLLVVGEGLITTLAGTSGGGAGEWLGHALTTTAPLYRGNYLTWLWPGALVSAGTMCAAGAILGHIFANHERDEDDRKEFRQMVRAASRAELAMTALLQEFSSDKRLVCVPGAMKLWANGAGETYEVHTGAAGMNWKDLNRFCDAMASRMMLADGCGIEAARGRNRGFGLLHVSRLDKLAENHNYPIHQIKKRNIYEGLPVGVLRPGDEVCIKIRENGVFLIGQKRSGKTTWLESLMASIAQTDDTLIWVIDFNGGGVALPYLYAWAEGRAARPMVDWVADTVEEAHIMVTTALEIAVDRKQFYKHRKRKANKTLLPIDQDVPQIVIIIDEGAEAMGTMAGPLADEVRESLEKLQRTAGDSGFNQVFSLLRATSDVANPAVKKQAPIRVSMRVSDSEELAYLFGDYKMTPEDAPHQGSGFILTDLTEPVRAFKGYNLDQVMMDEIAVRVSDWRPWMDPRGRQKGGRAYRDRWVRTQRLLLNVEGRLNPNLNLDVDADAPAELPAAANAPAVPVQGPATPAGTATTVLDPDTAIDERLSRRRRVAGMEPSDIEGKTDSVRDGLRRLAGGGGGDQRAAFEAIVKNEFGDDPPEWPGSPTGGRPPSDGPPPSAPPAGGGGGPVDRLAVLEQLVLQHGPIGRTALWEKLKEAGVKVSLPTMDSDLEKATWVAPRGKGQPYDHQNRAGNAKA